MKEILKKILLALIKGILGRYLPPKWAAALAGAQAGYAAGDQKEQEAAVAARVAKVQGIEAEVKTREDQAHEEVVSAADPDAVVNEQLWELGLVAADQGDDPGDHRQNAPGPADGKAQGG